MCKLTRLDKAIMIAQIVKLIDSKTGSLVIESWGNVCDMFSDTFLPQGITGLGLSATIIPESILDWSDYYTTLEATLAEYDMELVKVCTEDNMPLYYLLKYVGEDFTYEESSMFYVGETFNILTGCSV